MELFIVIMLGITAVLTAWASWVGSVHTGNQNWNYTISNTLSSEGHIDYSNSDMVIFMDSIFYVELNNMYIDLDYAIEIGDELEIHKLNRKIYEHTETYMGDDFYDALIWSWEETERTGEYVSPFWKKGFIDSYFVDALEILDLSQEHFATGQQDGSHSNSFGLTTVIYAMVLFLLGIANSFKTGSYRVIVVAIACVAFLFATLYMFSIPLPDGLFG